MDVNFNNGTFTEVHGDHVCVFILIDYVAKWIFCDLDTQSNYHTQTKQYEILLND